jgi:hypothetical protein
MAAMILQLPLFEAQIIDKPARARRLPEQRFLLGGWVHAIAVALSLIMT